MSYSGRVGLVLFVLISFVVYNMLLDLEIGGFSFVLTGTFLVMAWLLGERYDRVKYDAERDALTGLYNRRYVLDFFSRLRGSSHRRAEKLIVLFIDVDDFKSINDLYSHEAGDQVLQHIAANLGVCFPKSSHIVRWGGDEFVVIMPARDEKALHTMQTKFRHSLRTLPILTSVSIGSAMYPEEGIQWVDLMKSADAKMYKQKHNNHCVIPYNKC